MRFWVQRKAPAGNWVDTLGTNDVKDALSSAQWAHTEFNETTRVVERVDTEIQSFGN